MKTEFSTGNITKVYLNKIAYKIRDKDKRFRPTLQEFKECFEHLNHYFTLSENNGKILEQSIEYFKKTLQEYDEKIEDLINKNTKLSSKKTVLFRLGPFTLEMK